MSHCVIITNNDKVYQKHNDVMEVLFLEDGSYLDVLEKAVRTQQFERQDWGKIWRETSAVTPEEWEAIKSSLRASYDRIKVLINDTTEWPGEDEIGGAMATIVHTAYHLGEIRQALCIIKQ